MNELDILLYRTKCNNCNREFYEFADNINIDCPHCGDALSANYTIENVYATISIDQTTGKIKGEIEQ